MSVGNDARQAYVANSGRLLRQQAGLELVNHIRRCIREEEMRRSFKGDVTDELYYLIRMDSARIQPALKQVLEGKSPVEQKTIVRQILTPLRERGDMPPFSLTVIDKGELEPHLRLDYSFVM